MNFAFDFRVNALYTKITQYKKECRVMSTFFAVGITEGHWDTVADVAHFEFREQAEDYKRKVEALDSRFDYMVSEVTIVTEPLIKVEVRVNSNKEVVLEITDFNASEPVDKTYYNSDGRGWYSVTYETTHDIDNARNIATAKFENLERLVSEGKRLADAVDHLNLTDKGNR